MRISRTVLEGAHQHSEHENEGLGTCTSESPACSQLAGEALAQSRTSTDEGGRRANTARPATRPRPPSLASPSLCAYPLLVTLLTNLLVNPCSSPPSSPSPDYTSASPSFMENDSQSLNQALFSSFVHATQGGTRHVPALQTKSINRS